MAALPAAIPTLAAAASQPAAAPRGIALLVLLILLSLTMLVCAGLLAFMASRRRRLRRLRRRGRPDAATPDPWTESAKRLDANRIDAETDLQG